VRHCQIASTAAMCRTLNECLPALCHAQYYKISKEELSIGSLVDAITVRIATRDC
jgi:hypothetical protein